MEKDKTWWIFRITQYKKFEDSFLSETVVFIFRCISLRVLDFCFAFDEIIVLIMIVVQPYLSYCIKVSWCLLSFTWQFCFFAFRSLSILFTVHTRFHPWTWRTLLVPFIFRFERKNISGVDHRQDRPVVRLDTNWFMIKLSRYVLMSYAFASSSLNSRLMSWSFTLSTHQ